MTIMRLGRHTCIQRLMLLPVSTILYATCSAPLDQTGINLRSKAFLKSISARILRQRSPNEDEANTAARSERHTNNLLGK
mmetsp:Transcript_130080/g.253367  ORF Transcript_130080/g.253367 Transcript_130080/m.253367 type:complete len:80 (+) Transcript_130080:11-250(+)